MKPLLNLLTFDFIRNPRPKVAVIPLRGIIGVTGKTRNKGLTMDDLRETLELAFAIPGLKAVALAINSPGGSPVQSSMIHDAIRHLSDEKDIPVYAFAEDLCASGGYWLACAGEEIYAHNASIVGSIGVVSAGFGFPQFLARHGIERRVYTQGENKSMLDPFQPEKQEDINRLLNVQQDVHTAFKDLVKSRRGKRLNADGEELFSGAFWSGKQAKEMGLVDQLGDLRSVMQDKYGEKVKFITLSPKKGLIAMITGTRANTSLSNNLASEVVSVVEERLEWMRFGL